jgi:hypothetical protein
VKEIISNNLKKFHKSDSENEKVVILTALPSSLHAEYCKRILDMKLDGKGS